MARIVDDVRARGDAALVDLTARFDRWTPASAQALEVPLETARSALAELPRAERDALEAAAERIRRYHERQLQPSWRIDEDDGTMLGQRITALDRAGLYVPGGKAAYPSSVLMNAIPAQVAGVGEIIMVVPTPARRDGPSQDSRGVAAAGIPSYGVLRGGNTL